MIKNHVYARCFFFGEKASNISKREDIVHIQNKPQSGSLRVGKTLYHLNVYFGKTPLEEILKDKFLNSLKTQ